MTAAKLVAFAVGTLYAVQLGLKSVGTLDLVGSVIADLVIIAGVLAFARMRGLRLADLGVRRAPTRFFVAAVLLGVSAWYVTMWLVVLVKPPGDPAKLQQFVEQTPLIPTLVALTIVPAIAEELVFRGVLVRSLATRFTALPAIGISALVFGVYHLFPPQIVSTFALGLALGYLTLRARSIIPSIIVHTLNNTVAVVLTRNEIPALGAWLGAHPAVVFAGALVLVLAGLALATKGVA